MPSKLQGADIKNSTEIVAAGATIAQLPTDDQIYVSANSINKTLKDAIVDGDIVGGTPPKMLATISSPQTITHSVAVKVAFDTVSSDPNLANNTSWFNTSTNKYTPLKAGIYSVNFGAFLSGTNNRSYCSIYLNGSPFVSGGSGGTSGDLGMDVSFDVPMNGSTDYLEFYVFTYSSANVTLYGSFDTVALDSYAQINWRSV